MSGLASGELPQFAIENCHRNSGFYPLNMVIHQFTMVICYIAIENGPFIDGVPIKNGDCPWQTLSSPEGKPKLFK